MAQDVPLLNSDPWFRSTCPLDRPDGSSITMSFDFKWNARDLSWYFDVIDDAERLVIGSIRFIRGVYLGRRAHHEVFRNGAFVALCTVNNDARDAGFNDLGTRMVLRYFTVYDILLGRGVLPALLLP